MQTVRIERDAHVVRVSLARPEKRNAFDARLIEELTAAFTGVGDARAVVLAGDGPAFSAGADIEWMRASVALSHDENVADALRARRLFQAIDECPAPVICRVHGPALGGAAGLVACSDVAIAAPWPRQGSGRHSAGVPGGTSYGGRSACRCMSMIGGRS